LDASNFLNPLLKKRKESIGLIAVELKALWSKTLNFPHVSNQAICAKLANLLKDYKRCRKKQNFDSLDELFDVTKVKGEWVCKENGNLYKLQIESKGQIGYFAGPPASVKIITYRSEARQWKRLCPHLPAQST
jgi:hypothetical protein